MAWNIDNEPLTMKDESGEVVPPTAYQYDPRVVKVDDVFYVTWCNEFPGTGSPTIGVARTTVGAHTASSTPTHPKNKAPACWFQTST